MILRIQNKLGLGRMPGLSAKGWTRSAPNNTAHLRRATRTSLDCGGCLTWDTLAARFAGGGAAVLVFADEIFRLLRLGILHRRRICLRRSDWTGTPGYRQPTPFAPLPRSRLRWRVMTDLAIAALRPEEPPG